MNPITWLEQHPNAAVFAVVAGSAGLVVIAAWCIHWYVIDARYWFGWLHRERRGDLMFDDDWQRLDPDQAADQLTAEWHTDLPGPGCADREAAAALVARRQIPDSALAGELHHSLERTVTRDVWDEWWEGIDGLERECMLTSDWVRRESRLWAELKAETRELCAA